MCDKPPCTRRPALTVGTTWLVVPLVCWLAGSAWARAAEPGMWLDIIDLYLTGDYAAATSALEASLQRNLGPEVTASLTRLRQDISASAPATPERTRAVRRLQGAVLVPLESLLPLSARVADDARFVPLEDALRQAIEATVLPERSADPALTEFRARAQVGLMQFLINSGQLEAAERLGQAMRLPERNPDLRAEHDLLRGILRERTARLVTGAGTPGVPRDGGAAGGVSVRTDRAVVARRYWTSAARWYAEVLEARPGHVEAGLRLARTWLDRDQPERALALLAPLISRPCASTVCALAVLFTGEAHERRADLTSAAEAYRDASADPRTRQSAVLALLGLSLQGDGQDALAVARTVAHATSTDQPPDAWGVYVGGRREDAEAVLAPLRRGLRP